MAPDAESKATLAAANTAFAWDLYAALRAGDENLFFSPYSVSTALLMAREGARGETAAQMDAVLHLGGVDRATAATALLEALRPPKVRNLSAGEATPAYELSIANRVWGHEGYTFEDAFARVLADAYDAPPVRIDLDNREKARRTINAWVAEQTRDRIREIVPEGLPEPLTRLVLANAMYFKARWQDPFELDDTTDGDFHGPRGETVQAAFMQREEDYLYGEARGVQFLSMPYLSGRSSMVILLPRAVDGLASVEDALVRGVAARWLSRMKMRRVDLRFPRFEVDCASDLTSVLPAMGMPDAFTSRADFSGMTTQEELLLGAALHKAFVAVDEYGTEAAAATSMDVYALSIPPKPVAFHADRPFAFMIRHGATGTILFAGRVTRPL